MILTDYQFKLFQYYTTCMAMGCTYMAEILRKELLKELKKNECTKKEAS